MIIEYIRYQIPADEAEAFVAAYAEAAPALEASPHCLGFELSGCVEDPEAYILRIQWTSLEDHLEGFRKGEHFKAFLPPIRPYIGRIAEMRHYALTPVVSKGAS